MSRIGLRMSIALLLLLSTTGCSQHMTVNTDSYAIESGSVVVIDTFNGDITVNTYDGDDLRVEVERTSWRSQSELDKVEVTVSVGDTTYVEATKLERIVDVGVDFTVSIPEDVTVGRLQTSNGDITVSGGGGDLLASSSNGDITVLDFDGTSELYTSNGDITVRGGTLKGADTSNGDIEAEIRAVEGDEIILETSNGDVVVYLSPDLSAELVMDTSMGDISVEGLELREANISETEGTAILGEGGATIVLDTSMGDIEVHSL
ncbi:DUF4097 family beta strand repeat protein [Candidatus Fermentibacteria bacterium]|nr:DUF4097 family beta strand repeat protein [Candidatus Fermentibacteria bacterium]